MLSNFSLALRDCIHKENMMMYAKLKNDGGHEAAHVNDAGLPGSEAVARTKEDDSCAESNDLSRIGARVPDRIHKDNLKQYSKLRDDGRQETANLHGAALPVTSSESKLDILSSSAKKCSDNSGNKLSLLNARIRNQIHKESLRSYANLSSTPQQSAKEDISMSAAVIETEAGDSGMEYCSTAKLRGDEKISMLSKRMCDRIRQENLTSYAKFKSLHTRSNIRPAEIPGTKVKDASCDYASAGEKHDATKQKLKMLNTSIHNLIHRENKLLYANLAPMQGGDLANGDKPQHSDDKADQLNMLVARLDDRIHKEIRTSYAMLLSTHRRSNSQDADSPASIAELKIEDYMSKARNLSDSSLSTAVPEDESE
jgi:hypothetical protein